MKCYSCSTDITPESRHCSNCGVQLLVSMDSPPSTTALKIDKLLADANLQRIRGNFTQAQEIGIECLRLNVNSVATMVILGDICADQEKWHEAIQWYQMALDVWSKNKAIKSKLERAESMNAQSVARNIANKTGSSNTQNFTGTQNLAGLQPKSWFQILWLLAAIFVVVIVILLSINGQNGKKVAASPGTLQSTRSNTGNAVLPEMQQSLQNATKQSNVASVPARIYDNKQNSANNGLAPLSRDTKLTTILLTRFPANGDVTVTAVSYNSANQTANITLLHRVNTNTMPLATVRSLVVDSGLKAAQTAMVNDLEIRLVQISSRITDTRSTEDFFYGVVNRENVKEYVPDTPISESVKLYSNVWWAYPPTEKNPIENTLPKDNEPSGVTNEGTPRNDNDKK